MEKQIDVLGVVSDLKLLADKFCEGWHEGIRIDASDIILLSQACEALEKPQQPCQIVWLTADERELIRQQWATQNWMLYDIINAVESTLKGKNT